LSGKKWGGDLVGDWEGDKEGDKEKDAKKKRGERGLEQDRTRTIRAGR